MLKLDERTCIQEIIPGLFLSGIEPLTDEVLLRHHGINVVIQLNGTNYPLFGGIIYYRYEIRDIEYEDLDKLMIPLELVESALERNENVLIHCAGGVSRSPAFVIAFLILYKNYSFQQAFDHVKSIRTCINPNEGFIDQLKLMGLYMTREWTTYS